MKSLEAAERRRSEWEDKAAQITSKLRARETEVCAYLCLRLCLCLSICLRGCL